MSIESMTPNLWLALLLSAVTLTLGAGRLTRIITYDTWPPATKFRIWWAKVTNDGPWVKLFTCFWCLGPWVTLAALGWYVAGLYVWWLALSWWAFWGWLALSYVTSMIVARDEPAE